MLAALCAAGQARALPLQSVLDGLSPARVEATHALLAATAARLPDGLRTMLDGPVTVEWRDDLPGDVHGRAYDRRILLRRELLDAWVDAGPTAAAQPDVAASGAPTRAAVAALVHELAHVLDRGRHGGLSRDPRLLDLAGWQVGPLGGRIDRNHFTDRSPDPYELASPAEFLAVNLEHFVLDPAYACRRPALHRYFAARLGEPRPSADCAPGHVFLQAADGARDASPILELDASRIHAVDYLLAEPDSRPMSRWGHGMLRLVVCAPGRPPGPDCRLDLAHHVVLSFRAFVDDVQISSWRGLTGAYPSRLFVLPLEQVVDEYTKVELRGLQSVPLALSPAEVGSLLERAAALHWSYDGRYFFVSNNCAVETYRLLHDGVPRLAAERIASLTPTGLLRRLERAGIADTTVLTAPDARRLGHVFDPASEHYQAVFDTARAGLGLQQTDVREWLALPPEARSAWIGRADLRAAAALLVLEGAALRREEQRAIGDLREHLTRPGRQRADATDALATARDALRLADLLTRPAALLPGPGYGLPQQAEREVLATEGLRRASAWREQSDRLRAALRTWLPPARQSALRAAEANLERLRERLVELHRAGGGVDLDAMRGPMPGS